ncbi:MAG: acetyl-CoA C-acetyltransferase [Gammaproteobacteria bacterium]
MPTSKTNRPVFIVDGSRTPFLKARGAPGPFHAADLAITAARPLLLRQPFEPEAFDEVILGCVMPGPAEANIGRVVALRLGCGDRVPAWTVQRNCASGLQSIDSAYRNIRHGHSDLVLAGGVESMSHAPILLNETMVAWLAEWQRARTLPARMRALAQLRPKHLAVVVGLLKGLTDPVVGLNMGQTAEVLAYRFGISREAMDAYAAESHQRLLRAREEGRLHEIEPLYDIRGKAYLHDDGVREDSTPEKLAKLRPVFDRKFGKVTAGNSSQITDGAAWVILASEKAVKQYDLPVLARVVDSHWAGVSPAQMGLGPVHAVAPLVKRNRLTLDKVDYMELNEAFAAQVLACLHAWQDADYCRDELGLNKPLGEYPREHLNVDGGAIGAGHPVGASGTRITLRLLHILRREKARYGISTLCIGGGQGGALLIENPEVAGA